MGPKSNGARMIPPIASEGIHDTEVTDDSIRTAHTSSFAANSGKLRVPARPMRSIRHTPPVRGGPASQRISWLPPLTNRCGAAQIGGMPAQKISVFLADDNLIVREGVRALIGTAADMEVVGVASDSDELVSGAERGAPQVVGTDARMAATFQREGGEAA